MSSPITINAEVWKMVNGKRTARLKGHEIDLVISIAAVCADHRPNAYEAARRPWPKPIPSEPGSALECFLLIYRREPNAVLYVMQQTVKYLGGRSPARKMIAVRSLTRTNAPSIGVLSESTGIEADTLRQTRKRLNRESAAYAQQSEHPIHKFARAVSAAREGTKSRTRRTL